MIGKNFIKNNATELVINIKPSHVLIMKQSPDTFIDCLKVEMHLKLKPDIKHHFLTL
jgi:hypothetical protein